MKNKVVCFLVTVLLFVSMLSVVGSSSDTGDIINLGIAFPVQVVWDAKALVANKSTVIRLFVQSTFTSRVWVDVNVTYNFGMNWYLETGPYERGVPIDPGYNTIYIPGGPASPGCLGHWKFRPSMNLFWTRTGWDDKIEVTVDPLNRVEEIDETNNGCTFEAVRIVESRQLKILVVPLASEWYFPGSSSEWLSWLASNMNFLRGTYPVARDQFSWTLGEYVETHVTRESYPPAEYLYRSWVQELSTEARILGYDRLVAVIPGPGCDGPTWDGVAVGMFREPEDRVPVIVAATGLRDKLSLVAHEIGHTYYLWHPHDFGPPVYEATRYWVDMCEYGQLMNTFMSYRSPPHWIDNGRYDSDTKTWVDLSSYDVEVDGTWQWNLFDQLTAPEIRIPIIVAYGQIFLNGTVMLGSNWCRVPEGIPDILPGQVAPQKGNYSVVMLNSNKQMLSQTSFNVSFTYLACLNYTLTKMDTDVVPFVFSLPYFDGTTTIQIRNVTGHVIAEKAVTPNPPIVEVISPNGGESLGMDHNYTITWDAHDLDEDKLTYLVAYSRDNGNNWLPIANNVNEKRYVWDTSNLVQGKEYSIKVIATDGVNTGEDISDDAFEVLDLTPPIISNVTQNPPSDAVQPDQTVNVKVNVADPNSGVKNVTLMYTYRTNNGTTWSSWKNVPMENETGITFSSNISSLPVGTSVQYQIFAIDNADNTAFDDNAGKYYIYAVIPEFPQNMLLIAFLILITIPLVFAKKKHRIRNLIMARQSKNFIEDY